MDVIAPAQRDQPGRERDGGVEDHRVTQVSPDPAACVGCAAHGGCTPTWARGLTANRSRTNVPSHSDPGPPEILTRTRDRGGVTSLQGPDTPVMSGRSGVQP